MHWRLRSVLDWFARPFRPKGWCDRCRCVHEPPAFEDLEAEIVSRMAKQIEEEIDREILAELERLGTASEPGGQTPAKKEEPK